MDGVELGRLGLVMDWIYARIVLVYARISDLVLDNLDTGWIGDAGIGLFYARNQRWEWDNSDT